MFAFMFRKYLLKDTKEKWLNILRLHILKRIDKFYRKTQAQQASISRALRHIKKGKYLNTYSMNSAIGDYGDASKEVAQFAETIPFFIFSLLNHRIQFAPSYQRVKLSSYSTQPYVSDEEFYGNVINHLSYCKQKSKTAWNRSY